MSEQPEFVAGDEVLIRARISNVNPSGFPERPYLVDFAGSHGTTSTRMAADQIHSITKAALRPGNRVAFVTNPDSTVGTILHIDGREAWVRWDSRGFSPSYSTVEELHALEKRGDGAEPESRP